MKIIAYPARKNRKQNPDISLIYSTLVNEYPGTVIDEFSIRRILFKKYDIIHIHFPPAPKPRIARYAVMHMLFSNLIILLIKTAKVKGAKLVWTIHNLQPHESFYKLIEERYMNAFTTLVDGIICMNQVTVEMAKNKYPNLQTKHVAMIKHGSYEGYYENKLSQIQAREILEIPGGKKVVLFFGLLRKYKGIEELLAAFNEADSDFVLLVAGSIAKDQRKYFDELINRHTGEQIKYHCYFIKDEEVQLYFNAADLVVLPYTSILNSGTLILALTFVKPVLIKAHPSVKEMADEFGSNWVITYNNLNFNVIRDAYLAPRPAIKNLFGIERNRIFIAGKTMEFYQKISHSN